MFKFPPNGAVPQQNPSYPMAGLKSSAYAPPLNYNQPTEVVGGYDAKINPMTGQEMPVTNFARGGLASLRAPQVDDFTRGMHTGLAAYAGGGTVKHFDGGGYSSNPQMGSAAWNAMYGDTSLESDEYNSGFDYWSYLQDAADRSTSEFYIPTEDIFGSSWDSFNYNTSGGDDVDPAYFYGTTDTSGGGGFDYSDEGNTSEKLRQEEELRRQGEQAYEDYLARQNKTAEDVFESAGITPEDRDASRTQSLVEDARYGSLDDTLLSDIDKNISKYSDYWRPEFDFEKKSLLDKAKEHISDVLGLAGSTVAGLPGLVVGTKVGDYLERKLGGDDLPEVVVSSSGETPLPTGLSGGFTGGSYYPGGDDSGGGGGPDTSDLSKPMPTTLPPGTTTPTGVSTGPTVPDTPPTPPSKPPTDSTSSVNIPVSSQFLSAYDPMYTASNEQYGGSVEDQIRQYMQATNKSFRPGPITPYKFAVATEKEATPQSYQSMQPQMGIQPVVGSPEQRMAHGGMAHAGIGSLAGTYKAGGKLLRGPGDGMSDSIPAVIRGAKTQRAALADGEFVIPADVVSHLGNGSTEAGSRKLYDMMDNVRQARTGRKRQAPAVNANKYLPG